MQQWNGRRKHARFRRSQGGWAALIAVFAILAVFGTVKLIGYGKDYAASRQTAEELRQVSEAVPTAAAAPSATPIPTAAPIEPLPTPAPALFLEPVQYPGNANRQITPRFKALRKENKDIVGWLTLSGLMDEAVVQRDETYYMDHDALGKKNVNGAIFLDSSVGLKTRPYTLLLYGHNMKTGAMFGCLRNYENAAYYHKNPFITFDTMYEDGRYVILAVGTVSTEPGLRNSADFFALQSLSVSERQTAIDALFKASVFSQSVDVRPDDQLLLLITCVDREEERRVVAARRLRDGETEEELRKAVERSWKK